MPVSGICPQCGLRLRSDAPEGLCPECLLIEAMQTFGGNGCEQEPRGGEIPESGSLAKEPPPAHLLQFLFQ